MFRILIRHLRGGELIFQTSIFDAAILCDTMETFALEGAKGGFEGRIHAGSVSRSGSEELDGFE
jgi:hypothetical protein